MKEKTSKRKLILIICLAILLLVGIVIGYSFAYFSASVINGDTINNTVVTTAALEIEFTDGPQVSLVNSIPGTSVEKTFKIENKGTEPTSYDVYMSEVVNTFADKSDLVYTITSTDGGYSTTSEEQVPAANKKIIESQVINSGEEHNYTLRVEFKEKFEIQDDNKDKEFSVVIRVNEEKDPSTKTAVDYIKDLDNNSDLAYDGTADNNLRYIGANPNNYVLFNNELWRIIGVMNNTGTSSRNSESLLKIIRSESLGGYSWDVTESGINNMDGINQWGESTYEDNTPYEGADLMRELNTDYLGNITVGTDGYWYGGIAGRKETTMPTTLIDTTAQSMVESVVWNTSSPTNNAGTFEDYSSETFIAQNVYVRERDGYDGRLCTSGTYCNDTVNRTTSWTGKVALMYPSDYLFATSGGTTTNRNECLNLKVNYSGWGSSTYSDCKDNDWLNISTNEWTLSAYAHIGTPQTYNGNTFVISHADFVLELSDGYFYGYNAYGAHGVRPVVHLKSSVRITGGTGTSADPYTLV